MGTVNLRNISKSFGENAIIRNLSLEINNGEFITLLGPSGCGKTTLLRMIAGLESIDKGELYLSDKLSNETPAQKRPIAMVFQSYALFPHMNVRENILFGLKIQRKPRDIMSERLKWALSMFGLEQLENRLPREISGGQKQRVALARALVLDPDVLLLDEPLSNLDAALRDLAMEELKRIHQKVGKTVIYVTHNQMEAMTMSGRIAVLNGGQLEQYDTPKMVYDWPRTVFAAQFIGSPSMNFLEGKIVAEKERTGLMTPVGFLNLDIKREEQLKTMCGMTVRIGIRPHHISFVDHQASRRGSDSHIAVSIELIETMGDRSLVVGRTKDNAMIRFLVTRDEELLLNTRRMVVIDGRKIHLFNIESQLNILAPPAENAFSEQNSVCPEHVSA